MYSPPAAPQHAGGRTLFHFLTRQHHQRAVGDPADHADVVADEDQRHAEVRHQLIENVEDLLLHGDVERGGRLVGDQEFGAKRQRNGNADALALAAGQLVRKRIDALLGLRHMHALQKLDRLCARIAARQPAMQDQALGDLRADALRGIQRRHRLLKDHADALAADGAHRLLAKREQVLAAQEVSRPMRAPPPAGGL